MPFAVEYLLASTLFSASPAFPESQNMLPDSLHWDSVSFYGRTVEGQVQDGKTIKPPVFEKFRFEDIGLGRGTASKQGPKIGEETPLGENISRLVQDSLAKAFGNGEGRPDFGYLAKVFPGTRKSILKGLVLPGDEEKVRYYWVSPAEWLAGLKKLSDEGKRFKVSLAIIWMYQDVRSTNRFWAVVKQQWETADSKGNVLYTDDGFLFLNFDLDERRRPRDIRVHYRLWFYNYKRGDPKTGLKPHERIARDVRGALDASDTVHVDFGKLEGDRWVADAGQRGLSGVDRDLVSRMAGDLVKALRAARGE